MRYLFISLVSILMISCASAPKINTEPEKLTNLVHVSFVNMSIEDINLYLAESGRTETAIGAINCNENGALKRVDSLIPSGKSLSFIIPPGYYTIIPKKSDGRQNANFNLYEEFYLPPSAKEYTIHLNPRHSRTTTTSVTHQADSNPRLPLFDIRFRDEMIMPITEEHIELIGEDDKSVDVGIEWHNSRWLTIRPKEALLASARYKIMVGLGARNTEGERILETIELAYATGNVIDNISPFDLRSVKFDTSIPGYIRIDWNLPFGAHGPEIHINGGVIEDLQAKTNYTFIIDSKIILYKILPYRISPNGRKEYNQADLARQLTNIPQLFMEGVSISNTIITNTAYRQEFRINFHHNGIPISDFPPELEFILRLSENDLATLNTENNFTYSTDYPIYNRADGELTYGVIREDVILYSFTVKSPSAAEIQAAAQTRAASYKAVEVQRQREAKAAEARRQREEAKRKWQRILKDEKRFLSVGFNIGSSFETPLLIFNFNITIPVFPYTFLEAGTDIGLVRDYKWANYSEYHSLYYYGRFNIFLPWDDTGGWYFGIGGGSMDEQYPAGGFSEESRKFDLTTGFLLGEEHHWFRIGYSLRTNFSSFNHCLSLGYALRIF
jgi:hypothetical protein